MSLSELVVKFPPYQKDDIVIKYLKYPQFKALLDNNQIEYHKDLNMSLYSNLQKVESTKPFQLIKLDKLYVNMYAYRMDITPERYHLLYLLFIRDLDEALRQYKEKTYVFTYFHCLSESMLPYQFLIEAFRKFPIEYYAMLEKMYLVEHSIFMKTVGMFDRTRLFKLFKRKCVQLSSLKEYCKEPFVKKQNLIEKLPIELKVDPKIQKLKKEAEQNVTNILVETFKKRQVSVDCLTKQLNDHKFQKGFPVMLGVLLETLKSNPKYLELEGIFRKSGTIEEEEEIIHMLQNVEVIAPLKANQELDGFAIGGVAKKFFTKLLKPIVPYQLYDKMMKMQSFTTDQEVQFVRKFIMDLPNTNRYILTYMIIYLRENVINKKKLNKMNSYNLSVCFYPCFFRAEVPSIHDLLNGSKLARILDVLLSRLDEVLSKEQMENSVNRGSKESTGSTGSKGSKGSKGHNSKQASPSKGNTKSYPLGPLNIA